MKWKLEDYEKFLKENGVSYDLMLFHAPVRTVEEASKVANGRIIKTVVLDNGNEVVAVILPGEKRVDMSKFPGFRLANPSVVREKTGFPPGGIPPIVPGIRHFIDKSLRSEDWVVGGGGKETALLRIRVSDILRVAKPEQVEI